MKKNYEMFTNSSSILYKNKKEPLPLFAIKLSKILKHLSLLYISLIETNHTFLYSLALCQMSKNFALQTTMI